MLFLLVVTLGAATAYARAGGGNNWGGGGDSWGGGGGGYSRSSSSYGSSWRSSGSSREVSGPEAAFYVICCCIFVVVAIVIERKTRKEYEEYDEMARLEEMWRDERRYDVLRSADLERLRKADPQFDLQLMYRRVASAFVRVQKAWSDENLAPVRMLLSDGVFERFDIALKLNRQQGIINKFRNVNVHAVRLSGLRTSAHYEVATFAVSAAGTDSDIDIRTGKNRRSGNSIFTEYWTFVRRIGAKTPAGKGLLESCCPACSAPAKPTDVNRCGSCGTISLAGHHDWILSEITQQDAPRGANATDESLAALEIRDPAFSLQTLEDLASAIFWRIRAASNLKDASFLRSIMADIPQAFSQPARDIGVGSAVFIDHRRADVNGVTFDQVRVDVTWQATGQGRFITSIFLQRAGSVRTPTSVAMRPLTCHGCEAPLGGQYEALCSYCGAAVADTGKTWVLYRWKEQPLDSSAQAA